MVFRNKRDADLARQIYHRVPLFGATHWKALLLRMFHMADDSHLFRTFTELGADGWMLQGNVFKKNGSHLLPLYEAKMFHQFDNRFGTYEGQKIRC